MVVQGIGCVECLPQVLTSTSVEERVRSDICEDQHAGLQFGDCPSHRWHHHP